MQHSQFGGCACEAPIELLQRRLEIGADIGLDGERLPGLGGEALGARPLASEQGAKARDGSGPSKPRLVRIEKVLLQTECSLQPRQTFRPTTRGTKDLSAQLNIVVREVDG